MNDIAGDQHEKRRRVLILADDCNPNWPSLPIVGYNYAKAISAFCDVTVVTQIRNKPDIDKSGLGAAAVEYVDSEFIAAPVYKLAKILRGGSEVGWTLQMAMNYPSYVAFESKAWQLVGPRILAKEFDVVHRITPMSPTLPSLIAARSSVPFVLGPLNGGLRWPDAFKQEMRREREWLSRFRNAYRWLPFYRSTYQRSAAMLAAFDHTIAELPGHAAARVINLPEVGIDPERFSQAPRPARDRMTILFAGRLVPYKMPEIVLGAVAASPLLRRHRIVFVGDGPERPRLEAQIAQHGLQDCVELLGQRSQAEVGRLMRDADIFAFPSIRELGAGVVVEAMACAMACVVVDYGGPGTLIDASRGVKIPLGDSHHLVAQFRVELEKLVSDPARVRALGAEAARHAVDHYSWERKARFTCEVYDWVIGARAARPDFWRLEARSEQREAAEVGVL